VAAALGAYGATNVREVILRPRLRHLALALVARHPTLLKADLCYELVRNAGKPGFMKALNALLDYDFRDRLGDIRCPTLIVWGDADVMVPVKDASEFERVIPNARKVVMEDTGHVPMLERPETFNRCLIEFIAERRGAGERSAEEAAA
jgi:pimeloyl-ACP methyl ester carboxylesterase